MFANSKAKLPSTVRTVTPEDVADGVVKAIRRDRAEVVVAPAEMRVGGLLIASLPELAAKVQKASGGAKVSAALWPRGSATTADLKTPRGEGRSTSRRSGHVLLGGSADAVRPSTRTRKAFRHISASWPAGSSRMIAPRISRLPRPSHSA